MGMVTRLRVRRVVDAGGGADICRPLDGVFAGQDPHIWSGWRDFNPRRLALGSNHSGPLARCQAPHLAAETPMIGRSCFHGLALVFVIFGGKQGVPVRRSPPGPPSPIGHHCQVAAAARLSTRSCTTIARTVLIPRLDGRFEEPFDCELPTDYGPLSQTLDPPTETNLRRLAAK